MLRPLLLCGGLLATAASESTYAGDRDRRFLDCSVPCEFECELPEHGSRELVHHKHFRSAQRSFYPGYANDLGTRGKEAYIKVLREALQKAVAAKPGHGSKPGGPAAAGQPSAVATASLPLPLRLTSWTCEENCRYECMMLNSQTRKSEGEQQVHYYGKWPFNRVLGVQELMSSAFSALNGLPYLLLLASWPTSTSKRSRLAGIWKLHTLVHINTWLQSTLFHARDTPLTEMLDYHGATLGLTLMLCASVLVNLPRALPLPLAVLIALGGPLSLWAFHVAYLSFVSFDYGHNMNVAVGIGVASTLLWLIWTLRHWRTTPFAWKALVAALGPYVVLPLELLDFPPWFGLLDAHACWHCGTVPLAFLWCSFVRDLLQSDGASGAVEPSLRDVGVKEA